MATRDSWDIIDRSKWKGQKFAKYVRTFSTIEIQGIISSSLPGRWSGVKKCSNLALQEQHVVELNIHFKRHEVVFRGSLSQKRVHDPVSVQRGGPHWSSEASTFGPIGVRKSPPMLLHRLFYKTNKIVGLHMWSTLCMIWWKHFCV